MPPCANRPERESLKDSGCRFESDRGHVTTWAALSDPEPPPHPWWVWLLGCASVVVLVASVIAAITVDRNHHSPQSAASAAFAVKSGPTCDINKGRALRQLGATPADWASAHTQTYGPDGYLVTRWDPDPKLPRFRGHEGAVYNATTTFQDCVITSYYIQLVHATRPATALQRARAELPGDAQALWHRQLSQCVQYEFSSGELATQLDERGFDGPKPAAALVSLLEARPGDLNTITRVRLSLTGASIPRTTGGCFA